MLRNGLFQGSSTTVASRPRRACSSFRQSGRRRPPKFVCYLGRRRSSGPAMRTKWECSRRASTASGTWKREPPPVRIRQARPRQSDQCCLMSGRSACECFKYEYLHAVATAADGSSAPFVYHLRCPTPSHISLIPGSLHASVVSNNAARSRRCSRVGMKQVYSAGKGIQSWQLRLQWWLFQEASRISAKALGTRELLCVALRLSSRAP